MAKWKIDPVRDCCTGCGEMFKDLQHVFSVVNEDGDEQLCRRDYCEGCFRKKEDAVVFWETQWEKSGEIRKKVDFNSLLRLFEAWLENPPKGQKELVYLIALLLVRKRFFRIMDLVSEEGEEYLRLRRPGPAQAPFLVPAPLLAPAQLPGLRHCLESLLGGDLEEEVEAVVTPPEDAASSSSVPEA